jgi:drug/metabolite transporter (DMT)-like permease
MLSKPTRGPRQVIAAALLTVYIVWGTTYYALALAMQTLPPVLMNGTRFVLAGGVMLAVARWRGAPWPSAAQWRNCAVVGLAMTCAAMGLTVLAQQHGIGSGLMATVVTSMPLWLALWTAVGGEHVPRTHWVGMGLGGAGALMLALEGDFSTTRLGTLCAFGAPLCWSLGSYASRKLALPSPAMAAGAQWWVGGMVGTLVTLNAYLWLLQNAPPALAGSYSFVNPLVALAIGVLLGGEQLTGWIWLALPLILAALALILYGGPALALWRRRCAT